jgi:hypothetical protein
MRAEVERREQIAAQEQEIEIESELLLLLVPSKDESIAQSKGFSLSLLRPQNPMAKIGPPQRQHRQRNAAPLSFARLPTPACGKECRSDPKLEARTRQK